MSKSQNTKNLLISQKLSAALPPPPPSPAAYSPEPQEPEMVTIWLKSFGNSPKLAEQYSAGQPIA
jgi:hypothetical protein